MAKTSDLVIQKLSAKYADHLSKPGRRSYNQLMESFGVEIGSDAVQPTHEELRAEYGGTGAFDDNANAYWTSYVLEDSGVDLFTMDTVNTLDNTVTISETPEGYSFTGGGAPGAGNDRRIYYLDGSNVTNCEVRLTIDSTSGGNSTGQIGIAMRGADNGPAVVFWQNIFFAATGQLINGIWQYNGTTLQSTNQLANTNSIWGPDIVNASGSGTLVTVNCEGAHDVRTGHVLNLVGVGSFGQITVFDTPTADQFRFQSNVSGSWTGGNFNWVFAPAPRYIAARLVGSTFTSKCWLVTQPEPDWADPIRAEVNTIPGTLAVGGVSAPASGLVGIVVAHLGTGARVTCRDLVITNL